MGKKIKKRKVFEAWLPKGWTVNDLLNKGVQISKDKWWFGDGVRVKVTIEEIGH